MRWLLALLWAAPLWGQEIAGWRFGDLRRQPLRGALLSLASRPLPMMPISSSASSRSPCIPTYGGKCVSWMDPSFVHVDSVAADNPLAAAAKDVRRDRVRDQDDRPCPLPR